MFSCCVRQRKYIGGLGQWSLETNFSENDDFIKWRFSALLALCVVKSPVNGEGPVMRSFDVFFDLRLNKRLSKQSRRRWFETLSSSLWRHCNDLNQNFKHDWGKSVWKSRFKMSLILFRSQHGVLCIVTLQVRIRDSNLGITITYPRGATKTVFTATICTA